MFVGQHSFVVPMQFQLSGLLVVDSLPDSANRKVLGLHLSIAFTYGKCYQLSPSASAWSMGISLLQLNNIQSSYDTWWFANDSCALLEIAPLLLPIVTP
jgi:hypothetical protein